MQQCADVDFLTAESMPPNESNRRLTDYGGCQAYDRSSVTVAIEACLRHDVLYKTWTDGHAHVVFTWR
jgi:hypothetical protein